LQHKNLQKAGKDFPVQLPYKSDLFQSCPLKPKTGRYYFREKLCCPQMSAPSPDQTDFIHHLIAAFRGRS